MPSLKGPILGLIAAPLLTWGTYTTALQIRSGAHVEITGRRALTKRLFAWAAETLGPTGVLVAGGLATAAMLAWLILTLKRRKAAAKS